MNINHISISRKQTFDTCHAQYKFHYHLKTPSPEPEPFYFVYGKFVHRCAEEFVKNEGKKQLGVIVKEILNGTLPLENKGDNITLMSALPEDYKARLPDHLNSIQKLADQIGTTGITEWSFEYDLDPPNSKMVTGVIDRVIEKNGKYWIIDYKTTKKGKFRETAESIKTNLQLRCYARVVQKTYNVDAKNINTALYYVEGGNLLGARFTNESLLAAEKELLKTYNQIVAMTPENAWGRVGPHCNFCQYKKICPFKKRN